MGNISYFCDMKQTDYITLTRQSISKVIETIDYGELIYCRTGNAYIHINMEEWQLTPGSAIILFPGENVRWQTADNDFYAEAIRYNSETLRTASLNIEQAVYKQLRTDRLCNYHQHIQTILDNMFNIIKFYFTENYDIMLDRIVALHLQAFFLGYYDYQQKVPIENSHKESQRAEELFVRFMELLESNYRKEHQASYYADRMNITRKYLSIIVKRKTGHSTKYVIDEFLTLQLKLAIRTTNCSMKQISADFCFPNPSVFTRFFRTHVGMLPQKYRLGK